MSLTTNAISFRPSLESIISSPSSYDTYLLDMWGVLHDGTNAYDGAIDAVRKIKESGGRIVILSNSSKRKEEGIKVLGKLGFDVERDIDKIITSGEVSFRMLSGDLALPFSWQTLSSLLPLSQSPSPPPRALVLGSGAGDVEYVQSAGWAASGPSDADLIVARGTFAVHGNDGAVVTKEGDGEEAYGAALNRVLRSAAKKKIPMLVTNPDRIRPDADLSPMPGSIGDAYEKILGETMAPEDAMGLVRRIGKPHREVYDLALDGDAGRTVMVGDALATDVTGGGEVGVDTVWVVRDGVHFKDIRSKIEGGMEYEEAVLEEMDQFNKENAGGSFARPTFCVPNFRW